MYIRSFVFRFLAIVPCLIAGVSFAQGPFPEAEKNYSPQQVLFYQFQQGAQLDLTNPAHKQFYGDYILKTLSSPTNYRMKGYTEHFINQILSYLNAHPEDLHQNYLGDAMVTIQGKRYWLRQLNKPFESGLLSGFGSPEAHNPHCTSRTEFGLHLTPPFATYTLTTEDLRSRGQITIVSGKAQIKGVWQNIAYVDEFEYIQEHEFPVIIEAIRSILETHGIQLAFMNHSDPKIANQMDMCNNHVLRARLFRLPAYVDSKQYASNFLVEGGEAGLRVQGSQASHVRKLNVRNALKIIQANPQALVDPTLTIISKGLTDQIVGSTDETQNLIKLSRSELKEDVLRFFNEANAYRAAYPTTILNAQADGVAIERYITHANQYLNEEDPIHHEITNAILEYAYTHSQVLFEDIFAASAQQWTENRNKLPLEALFRYISSYVVRRDRLAPYLENMFITHLNVFLDAIFYNEDKNAIHWLKQVISLIEKYYKQVDAMEKVS
ncbi:MAG: hypothetical protein R3A45_12385 [Bdellovibrionota bacterium]